EPEAVVVLGVVEEVAADLVARQHAAGDVRTLDGGDPRREQVRLYLAGGVDLLAPAGTMDDVGVATSELQRERRLICQAPEVAARASARDQNAHRAGA